MRGRHYSSARLQSNEHHLAGAPGHNPEIDRQNCAPWSRRRAHGDGLCCRTVTRSKRVAVPLVDRPVRYRPTEWLTQNARAETPGRCCFYRELPQEFSDTPSPFEVSPPPPSRPVLRPVRRRTGTRGQKVSESLALTDPQARGEQCDCTDQRVFHILPQSARRRAEPVVRRTMRA